MYHVHEGMKVIPREVRSNANPVETTRQPLFGGMDQSVLQVYLFGALHDGTFNRKHNTWRIAQSNMQWLKRLQKLFRQLGSKSWIYREGKNRTVSVIETTASFLNQKVTPQNLTSRDEQIAYIRGYFDAEGGVPKRLTDWMYIQLCQKDKDELQQICLILESLGIHSGKIHNPSQKIDPDYWRFFILRRSHQDFIRIIGSWHPRKEKILANRVKI